MSGWQSDPIFEAGAKVSPIYIEGFYGLTLGKTYTVVRYQPRDPSGPTRAFSFPAYVTVIGDFGVEVTAHAQRFERVE